MRLKPLNIIFYLDANKNKLLNAQKKLMQKK